MTSAALAAVTVIRDAEESERDATEHGDVAARAWARERIERTIANEHGDLAQWVRRTDLQGAFLRWFSGLGDGFHGRDRNPHVGTWSPWIRPSRDFHGIDRSVATERLSGTTMAIAGEGIRVGDLLTVGDDGQARVVAVQPHRLTLDVAEDDRPRRPAPIDTEQGRKFLESLQRRPKRREKGRR